MRANLKPLPVLLGAFGFALLAAFALWPRAPKSSGSVVAIIRGARFTLDRLETHEARIYGLKGAESLAPDRGALFRDPARRSGIAVFTMEGCRIPLDMVFLDQAGRVQRIDTAQPGAPEAFTAQGPVPRARLPALRGLLNPSWAVLEIRAGRANELGLKQGDSVSFEPPFPQ